MLLRKDISTYYVNTSLLSYLLTGKYPADNNLVKNIAEGIEGLEKKYIIKFVISQEVKNEWLIDADLIVKDKVNKSTENYIKKNDDEVEYYSAVQESAINKILMLNERYYTKSISLLRFYIYLLTTIFKKKDDKNEGVGFTSIQKMVKDIGYNRKTITSYLATLSDLELIYIYKPKDFILFEDGDIIEISHTYGKYENKDKVIAAGKSHESKYGEKLKSKHKKVNKIKSDKTRGLSQKYRHIYRCFNEGKEIPYTYRQCKEIYDVMRELNKRNESEHPDRVKDLSLFIEYDFYETS